MFGLCGKLPNYYRLKNGKYVQKVSSLPSFYGTEEEKFRGEKHYIANS